MEDIFFEESYGIHLQLDDIVQQYVKYVATHYGINAVIVFDGYTDRPSTKDHEHLRRSMQSSGSIDVSVKNHLEVEVSKKASRE